MVRGRDAFRSPITDQYRAHAVSSTTCATWQNLPCLITGLCGTSGTCCQIIVSAHILSDHSSTLTLQANQQLQESYQA
jgi:hypothetical protein